MAAKASLLLQTRSHGRRIVELISSISASHTLTFINEFTRSNMIPNLNENEDSEERNWIYEAFFGEALFA